MQSRKIEELKTLVPEQLLKQKNALLMVQFFELSDSANQILYHFFHDRVWFYYQNKKEFQIPYLALPFKSEKYEEGENCSSFCYPFVHQRWLKIYPQLKEVHAEMGDFSLFNAPLIQFFENTHISAYRGSFILSNDPAQTKEVLSTRTLKNSFFGSQIQLDKPVVPLEGEDASWVNYWLRQIKIQIYKPIDEIRTH